MILHQSQNPLWSVKKGFSQRRVMLHFCPVKYFLCIFKTCYACKKHCLRSKESFGIICGTTRHIQVDSRQEKVNFVDFWKMTLHQSENPLWSVKKSFFQKRVRLHFLSVKYFLCIFKTCYTCKKHCLRSNESFHIIFGTTRHLQVDSREERINFVDFSKSHSRRVKIQFGVSKKGFFESVWSFIFCQ